MRQQPAPWLPAPPSVPTAVSSTDAPSVRVNPHSGRIISLSPAFCRMYGAGAETLVDAAVTQLWPPDLRPSIARQLEEVVLLGRTMLSPLETPRQAEAGVRLGVTARYEHRGAEHVEIIFDQPSHPAPSIVPGRAQSWSAEWPDEVPRPAGPGFAAVLGDAKVAARPITPESVQGVALALSALEAANVAAAAVSAAGRITAVTAPFRTYVCAGSEPASQRLTEWVALSEASAAALEDARTGGRCQSVRVELPRQSAPVVMEWLPAGGLGAGLVILTTTPNADQAEQLRVQAQVVAQISHDVRDQLSAIGSGLNTLLEQLPIHSTQRDYVERLRHEATRAINIVKDGLDFARPGCSTPTRVALDELVGETLDHYRPRAAARGVALNVRLGAGPVLMGDRTGLARIFSNLVDNALHAMPCGGALSISATPEMRASPGWRVVVTDTGKGIKPERLATLFDPAVSHREGGTGLGLAITRRYVVDHGGQIHVDSVEGQGTTFTIWLPVGSIAAASGESLGQ